MKSRRSLTVLTMAGALVFSLLGAAAQAKPARADQQPMTLGHVKNGSFEIPDLACGYKVVKLTDGALDKDGTEVVLGKICFGDLNQDKKLDAVVHIASSVGGMGWTQQIAFIIQDKGKLLQVADYRLADYEEFKDLQVKSGEVQLRTMAPQVVAGQDGPTAGWISQQVEKLAKIKLTKSGQSYTMRATEWQTDLASGELKPYTNLANYIVAVEDRIGSRWQPTNRDKAESVSVTFKILRNGNIADLSVSQSSEIPSADSAALQAVAQAAPFAPLPADSQSIKVSLEFQGSVYCTNAANN
jgi:TonB family protein